MKKLFLIIPVLLFLIGCEYIPIVDYNYEEVPDELYATEIVEYPDEITIEETNNEYGRIVFSFNWETDAALSDGKLAFRVVYVTDEFLSKYDSNVKFVEEGGVPVDSRDFQYAFLPYTTLYDFQWIGIGTWEIEGVVGIQFYKRSVLYSAGDLPPGVPFIVTPKFQDMPGRGISFVDENRERRYFMVLPNMADQEERPGSFIILEFDNTPPQP